MTTLAPSPRTGEDDPWAGASALLPRVARGDQLAFAELYDLTAGGMFGLLRGMVDDPLRAEKLLEDVFLDVWTRAASFPGRHGSVASWLYGIARRAAARVEPTGSLEDGSAVA
ncbi:sigma factor [Microbacterium sp. GCS4]|uniref:sigma factor n=1 Tax=Microbacterium sp. GCS4 TaxID=1692239 RepID=UPI0013793419|nr:sigma factor [Microbacterium sp. GCS4]